MKKFNSILMLAIMCIATLSFTACGGDDDDNGGSNNASIVGVWKCSSVNYGEWEGMLKDNTQVGDIFTLNSDNTYSIKGNNNENGRYSVYGNTLKVTSDGVAVEFNIIELTTSTLTIVQKELGFRLSFMKQK